MTASSTRFTRLALIPGVAVAMILASLALSAPAEARKIRSDFFGMHDSQIANGSVPTVKLGSIRLWDSGTAWNQIETAPGVFDWSRWTTRSTTPGRPASDRSWCWARLRRSTPTTQSLMVPTGEEPIATPMPVRGSVM